MKFLSQSVSKTLEIASQFVKVLQKNTQGRSVMIGLQGDLGAGKTTFVKGMAKGLGLDPQQVTSPTFTLVNEYGPLIHVDLYRLEKEAEAENLGLEEYLVPGRLLVVEWPEKFPEFEKQMTVHIFLKYISEKERHLEITPWPLTGKFEI